MRLSDWLLTKQHGKGKQQLDKEEPGKHGLKQMMEVVSHAEM